MSLDVILSEFASERVRAADDENIELEIRFNPISREDFVDCHAALMKKYPCECELSINFISKPDDRTGTNTIRTVTISVDKKGAWKAIGDAYGEKTPYSKSMRVKNTIPYKISMSKERTLTGKPVTAQDATVRFKARSSFTTRTWRFDLTAVKSAEFGAISNDLKALVGDFFRGISTCENYVESLNHEHIDQYEVEIEWVGKAAPTVADFAVADELISAINPLHVVSAAYQNEIYAIAQLILDDPAAAPMFKNPNNKLKRLGNQVLALTKQNFYADVYPLTGWFVLQKTDGQRVFVVKNGTAIKILMSDNMLELTGSASALTVADCELIGTADKFDLKVFDVMVFEGENISSRGYEIRSGYIDRAVAALGAASTDAKPSTGLIGVYSGAPVHIETPTEDIPRVLASPMGSGWANDGLIFVRGGDSYQSTRNYKWKPIEQNTIDFLAVKCPQKLLGIAPYNAVPGKTLYLLFCGISHEHRQKIGLGIVPYQKEIFEFGGAYYPVQFSPSVAPLSYLYYDARDDLSTKIIELGPGDEPAGVGQLISWKLHRVRDDRKMEKTYFGNDFKVAEIIFSNFIDPFPIETLWTAPSHYFSKLNDEMHRAPNKYKRFVISTVMRDNFKGVVRLVDLAAGRGSELHRCQEIGVKSALFIDIDPTAIAELIKRKHSFFESKRADNAKRGGWDTSRYVNVDKLFSHDTHALTVHTMVADMKTPSAEIITRCLQFGYTPGTVSGCICNFAFHYFCDSIENMRNVLGFVARMLTVNGTFMMTVMDGAQIFAMLKDLAKGARWESREGEAMKYAITKKYDAKDLRPAGQTISVLLPFSDESYDEPLCNVSAVIDEAERIGLEVELNTSMDKYFSQFERMNKRLFDALTPADKEYIAIFRVLTFRLVREYKGGRARGAKNPTKSVKK